MSDSVIYGRNAVLEALKAGRNIEKLYVDRPPYTGSLGSIVNQARKARIQIQETGKDRLSELSEGGNHQGVVAVCAAVDYV